MNKQEFKQEILKVFNSPKIAAWYDAHLQGSKQFETIDRLYSGFVHGELNLREALTIAFVIGLQWEVKFQGVP